MVALLESVSDLHKIPVIYQIIYYSSIIFTPLMPYLQAYAGHIISPTMSMKCAVHMCINN